MRVPSKYSRRTFLGASTASFGLMTAGSIASAEPGRPVNSPVEDVGDALPGPDSEPADDFVRKALGIEDLVVEHGPIKDVDGTTFVLGGAKGDLRYVFGANVLLPRAVIADRERLAPGYNVAIGSHEVGGSNVVEFVTFPTEMRSGEITRVLSGRRVRLGGEVFFIDDEAHLSEGGSRSPIDGQLRAGDVVDLAVRERPAGEPVIEFMSR